MWEELPDFRKEAPLMYPQEKLQRVELPVLHEGVRLLLGGAQTQGEPRRPHRELWTPEQCQTGQMGATLFPEPSGAEQPPRLPDLIYLKLWLLSLVFVEMTLGPSSHQLRTPLRT